MAAGLGTRLRPLTYEVPKPMVPVANRPIMEHVLRLVAGHGMREVIANLHWFPETIRGHFGDGASLGIDLTYSEEESLLGTAGGVRNVRDWFGSEPFLVMAGRSAHRHRPVGPRRRPPRQRRRSRRSPSSRSPTSASTAWSSPAPTGASGLSGEARPRRGALGPGELHDLRARARDLRLLPGQARRRLRPRRLPGPARARRARSTSTRRTPTGTTSARSPSTCRATSTSLERGGQVEADGELIEGGARRAPARTGPGPIGSVLLGDGAEIGAAGRAGGPARDRPGARVGAGAIVKESVLLPGAEVPAEAMVVGSIVGRRSVLAEAEAMPAPRVELLWWGLPLDGRGAGRRCARR